MLNEREMKYRYSCAKDPGSSNDELRNYDRLCKRDFKEKCRSISGNQLFAGAIKRICINLKKIIMITNCKF